MSCSPTIQPSIYYRLRTNLGEEREKKKKVGEEREKIIFLTLPFT